MITLDILQGTPLWHSVRAKHFTASEASAALGLSKYTTRNDLLKQKASGLVPEEDVGKARLFAKGHEAEAAARPIVELLLGEDLFPCVGTLEVDGLPLLASFDGITMGEDVIWETKLLNMDLLQHMEAGDLDPHYWLQIEQQLLVSSAEKCYFTTTDGTEENTFGIWYTSVPERRAKLIAGWKQFQKDLAAYQHIESPAPVVAAATESLPAVSVRLNGQLAVATNLPEFGVALRSFVKTIPAKPSTDQEFADCEAACKALKKAEDALTAAEDNAMAQVTDVETMRRLVGDLKTLARTARLASEKVVTARKEAIRIEIITEAKNKYANHVADLNKRNGKSFLGVSYPDFATAIKGKRTIDSLHEAVDTLLANAKIDANAVADRILSNISLSDVKDFHFLFNDLPVLCLKESDDFKACVAYRVTEHQAKEDARIASETARIRSEVERQERARAEHNARVEQERLSKEQEVVKALATEVLAEAKEAAPMVLESRLTASIAKEIPATQMVYVRQGQRASTRSLVDNILDGASEAMLQEVLSYLQINFVKLAA